MAIADGAVVGTVTLSRIEETRGCAFYDRPDVASFGQFAVEPALQGRGVGSMLLDVVDALAMERGVGQLALDTAAPATDLIAYYTARGFSVVDHLQWEAVNYPSVVLARPPRMPQHLR